MTYGVPYSFVPGTKARADEVNANFIEVLNKIEETNSRIDDVNTQTNLNKEEIKKKLEEGLEQKAGLDLANLDSAGKAILNNKANATDLDGKWTSKSLTLVSGGYLGPVAGATVSFSLSSYLPADNNIYDVIFRTDIEGYSKGCYGLYALASDLINNWFTFGRVDYSISHYAGSTLRLPVSSTRKIYLKSNSSTKGSNTVYIAAIGYRKVR